MSSFDSETLLNIGFLNVGGWRSAKSDIEYFLEGERAQANRVLLDEPNALYAFVQGERVLYIGKTTRSVKKRFVSYRKPGKTQPTNLRCNAKIREALAAGKDIRVFVFAPISALRYFDFDINLAAGLEDALIKAFDPPWNGREKGKPVSEDAEREAEQDADFPVVQYEKPTPTDTLQLEKMSVFKFEIKLGQAYYHQGLINPGVAASKYLGDDGDPIRISFEGSTEPVLSAINRTANPSGSVRVVGHNRQIADWFKAHYRLGDTVVAHITDAYNITLTLPATSQ